MVTYTMTPRGLAVSTPGGTILAVPLASVPAVAVLFLAEGETLETRPENPDMGRWTRTIAYGVTAGRYRRLPIVVGR